MRHEGRYGTAREICWWSASSSKAQTWPTPGDDEEEDDGDQDDGDEGDGDGDDDDGDDDDGHLLDNMDRKYLS